MLILLMGFVVLKNPATARNVGGICIALVGMVLYAHQVSAHPPLIWLESAA